MRRPAIILALLATSLVYAVPTFAADDDTDEATPKKKKKKAADSEGGGGSSDSDESTDAPPPPPKKKKVLAEVAPAAPTPPAAPVGDKDHDKVVGGVGVGYLGQLDVPLSAEGGTLPTQIVGIRYWSSASMAITAGLGFGWTSSSKSSGGTTVDGPSATAFALKGGLAFPLATGKHFTFVLEPQFVFGSASQTIKVPGSSNTELSGYRFSLGGTAGAEIQFGFIGIHELALVSTVGLALDVQSGKSKTAAGESSASRNSISTFTLANPWNIFSGNIAAVYYF